MLIALKIGVDMKMHPRERNDLGDDKHMVEYQIGDSVIIVNAGVPPQGALMTLNSIYVYVDEAFTRATAHGSEVISAPEHKPYQERQAGVRDTAGNVWWISCYTG
jgi:PhnB protein